MSELKRSKWEEELIPGLPEEIALECLTRLHYSGHRVASWVCKRWRHLILSRDFYYLRKQAGQTRKFACLVQSVPSEPGSVQSKQVGAQPKYGLTLFDPVNVSWERLDPVPDYPGGLPLFCQVVCSEGKLVLMGGWDPSNYEPLRHVFVYEFTTRKWRRGRDMPESRSFFAAGELAGRVVIAGGHDVNKDALNSAWTYNVDRDEWTELPRMSQERDECEGVIVGNEFVVVSGYKTQSQGGFDGSVETISIGGSEWRRVEAAWEANQCPRSCVGVGKGGKLISWAASNPEVKVGACGVQLGGKTLVSGSGYQGGPQGFFLVDDEEIGKWKRLSNVPYQFSGYVPSGCCVEI